MSCCCSAPKDGEPPSPREKVSKGDIPDLETMNRHYQSESSPMNEDYKSQGMLESADGEQEVKEDQGVSVIPQANQ
jgi:hypothetical protein